MNNKGELIKMLIYLPNAYRTCAWWWNVFTGIDRRSLIVEHDLYAEELMKKCELEEVYPKYTDTEVPTRQCLSRHIGSPMYSSVV